VGTFEFEKISIFRQNYLAVVKFTTLQSREKRGGYITHSAQLAWPNAGGTPDQPDTALMHAYMLIMYFACACFVL